MVAHVHLQTFKMFLKSGILTGQSSKKVSTPYLLIRKEKENKQMFIMHNDTMVTEIPKNDKWIGTGLILLVGAYFIYHFEYPKECSSFFMFLQQFVLNIPPQHESSSYIKIRNKYLLFVNSHF